MNHCKTALESCKIVNPSAPQRMKEGLENTVEIGREALDGLSKRAQCLLYGDNSPCNMAHRRILKDYSRIQKVL